MRKTLKAAAASSTTSAAAAAFPERSSETVEVEANEAVGSYEFAFKQFE